jgi:hypothetical protein
MGWTVMLGVMARPPRFMGSLERIFAGSTDSVVAYW